MQSALAARLVRLTSYETGGRLGVQGREYFHGRIIRGGSVVKAYGRTATPATRQLVGMEPDIGDRHVEEPGGVELVAEAVQVCYFAMADIYPTP